MLSERSPEQTEHILYATITKKLQKVKIIYVKVPGMRVQGRLWDAGLGCENSLSTLWYRYFLRYMLCFDKKNILGQGAGKALHQYPCEHREEKSWTILPALL